MKFWPDFCCFWRFSPRDGVGRIFKLSDFLNYTRIHNSWKFGENRWSSFWERTANKKNKNKNKTRSYTADAVWYRQPSGQPMNTVMLNLNWLHVEEVSWQWSVGRVTVPWLSMWYDVIWRDMTWRDMMWHYVTLHDVTWRSMTWRDMTWCDMTWHDVTWRGMTWREITWHDVTWRDMTWHDVTWRDMMWHDMTLRDMTMKLTLKRWSCDRPATFARQLINLELLFIKERMFE